VTPGWWLRFVAFAERSGLCSLCEHRRDDHPMKWQDDRQIGAAQTIVRTHESGCGQLTPRASKRYDIDGDAKVQVSVVQTEHHTFWCFSN